MDSLNSAIAAGAGGDYSFVALFARAHLFVQMVIVVLVAFSIWSWAVMIEKFGSYRQVRRTMAAFDEAFWSGGDLEKLYERVRQAPNSSPIERVFIGGMEEWRRSFVGDRPLVGTPSRVERVLHVEVAREVDRLRRRLGVLASVGSTAPFIGLFGTVWGIKNSFEAIALSQNTNLAVVAPGIAEALAATALGLLAAIPAVIGYNWFQGEAERIGERFEAFADEFTTLLSRQLAAMQA